MLPLNRFSLPHDGGSFGTIRKYDVHTGVDLYCNPGASVHAIEDGVIVGKGPFTGARAGSEWWNDTDYVAVEGKSGIILYGEIHSLLELDVKIKEGEIVGSVATVLKKRKTSPMTMLHLELYDSFTEPVEWKLDTDRPSNLMDPMPIITKELWKYYNKNHKSHEVIEIPEGEWFNIPGRGSVMTVELLKLDPAIRLVIGDNVKVANKLYSIRGIEYPSRQNEYAGLLLREIIEEK